MAVLLTGKPVADALSADTCTRAEALLSKGVQPRLVLLRCGDNEADGAYIRGAVKRAALCGVAVELRTLPADASADVVAAAIDAVNRDPAVHGCLLLRIKLQTMRAEEARQHFSRRHGHEGAPWLQRACCAAGPDSSGWSPATQTPRRPAR
jgi:hypothetical protein